MTQTTTTTATITHIVDDGRAVIVLASPEDAPLAAALLRVAQAGPGGLWIRPTALLADAEATRLLRERWAVTHGGWVGKSDEHMAAMAECALRVLMGPSGPGTGGHGMGCRVLEGDAADAARALHGAAASQEPVQAVPHSSAVSADQQAESVSLWDAVVRGMWIAREGVAPSYSGLDSDDPSEAQVGQRTVTMADETAAAYALRVSQ